MLAITPHIVISAIPPRIPIILIILCFMSCVSSWADYQPVVVFTDAALEAKLREAMSNPEGDITVAEAAAVVKLDLSNESFDDMTRQNGGIRNISDLRYFTSLEDLNLSYNDLHDLSPLAELTSLKYLGFTGIRPDDFSVLKGLTNLVFLGFDWTCNEGSRQDGNLSLDFMADMKNLEIFSCKGNGVKDITALGGFTKIWSLFLDDNAITDISALANLTNLKELKLNKNPISDYSPLKDIYPKLEWSDLYQSLEQKDFTIALTLSELEFVMSDAGDQADYHGEEMSVSINHSEWGTPSFELNNCVKMYLQLDSGYTLIIMYYPEIDAYVFQMLVNNEMTLNYVYDVASGEFTLNPSERESTERIITTALGETDAEDILLAPIPIFNDTIRRTFGMTADALYALPYEPSTLRSLGFGFVTDEEGNAAYAYHEHEPHDMHISVYRSPWGVSNDGWSIELYDDDVNGYSLLILYFADEGRYTISLRKDGAAYGFDNYPATGEKGGEYPDLDTVCLMFSAAFETEDEELYHEPLTYFERVIQERFGISTKELYVLPKQ